MKTKAAILRGTGQDFEITELELDPPKAGEVLIRYVAAGLCHSDEHVRAEGGSQSASRWWAGTRSRASWRRSNPAWLASSPAITS